MASQDAARAASGRSRHCVLIVEPDGASADRLSHLFIRFGYDTLRAETAHEAFVKACGQTPSLLIASSLLPDMNAVELLHHLGSDHGTARIPVLVLLNRADRDRADACVKLGAAGCLLEPVEAEVLFRSAEQALEKNPRRMLRVRTVLPVKVHGGQHEALYGAYTLALSSGGMLLHTMNPVSVNSELSLEFELDGRLIAADGVVLYNCQAGCGPDADTGVGLRFTDITAGDRNSISDFVRNQVMKDILPAAP